MVVIDLARLRFLHFRAREGNSIGYCQELQEPARIECRGGPSLWPS